MHSTARYLVKLSKRTPPRTPKELGRLPNRAPRTAVGHTRVVSRLEAERRETALWANTSLLGDVDLTAIVDAWALQEAPGTTTAAPFEVGGGGVSNASLLMNASTSNSGSIGSSTAAEASDAGSATATARSGGCVVVQFGSNDLRLHDNYTVAAAAEEAKRLGVPLVGVYVFDPRLLAQGSLLGGFFRASPARAKFLTGCVAALREKLRQNGSELLVRVGRPEVLVPRLARVLRAHGVYATTQYAPHEQYVQDEIRMALMSPHGTSTTTSAASGRSRPVPQTQGVGASADPRSVPASAEVDVTASRTSGLEEPELPLAEAAYTREPVPFHAIWNTTLLHIDDLVVPPQETPELMRAFWDQAEVVQHRPVDPYDCADGRLIELPVALWNPHAALGADMMGATDDSDALARRRAQSAGIASAECPVALSPPVRGVAPARCTVVVCGRDGEDAVVRRAAGATQPAQGRRGMEVVAVPCGRMPELSDLGYTHLERFLPSDPGDVAFNGGEDAAFERLDFWLNDLRGLREYVALGRLYRSRIPQLGKTAARLSPWVAHGALSPRMLYNKAREFSFERMGQNTTEAAVRELHFRLAQRDHWHWLGVKWGRTLYFPFGPRAEETSDVPDPRYDKKVVQRWCAGLTGIPFADASMRELTETGWANSTSRRGLVWLLARGYGQDWRLAAEWLERCSLDYDPCVTWGNCAYFAQLLPSRFAEPHRSIRYLASQADATGIYTKRWLPQLERVPDTYLHRVHVMTKRMQKMHAVELGRSYPYPIKLWRGALETLPLPLPRYFEDNRAGAATEPGWGEGQRLSASPLDRSAIFPYLTPVAMLEGELVQSGQKQQSAATDVAAPRSAEEDEEAEPVPMLAPGRGKAKPLTVKRAAASPFGQ